MSKGPRTRYRLRLPISKSIISKPSKKPQLMIRLLVKEVVLYDDRVEVYYNCIDKKRGCLKLIFLGSS